jgi:hypothetical protein
LKQFKGEGYNKNDPQEDRKVQEIAFEQFLAYAYLENSDKAKYGSLLNNLRQQQSLKHDQYPKFILMHCGFQGSLVDPCLWIKHLDQGIVIIAIYVDDCLIIGDDSNINEVIEELKGYNFGLKVEEHLSDYLSCQIITNLDDKMLFIMQPHLIKNLEVKFGAEILSNYGMPGTPRFKL